MIKSFCVGHVPPYFNPSNAWRFVCPHSVGVPNEIVISDRRFGHGVDGAALSEYSQLFGLSELIKAGDLQADTLHFFQYRKFISPWSQTSKEGEHWVNYISPMDAESLFPTPSHLDNAKDSIIIGKPFQLGMSIAENYGRSHVAEDFAMFCAACSRTSVLAPDDVKSLCTATQIIFSPALSVISTSIFLQLMDIMQSVWKEFIAFYQVEREGYQRRSTGYLLERLHSYLIYSILEREKINVVSWNRYIVVPTG